MLSATSLMLRQHASSTTTSPVILFHCTPRIQVTFTGSQDPLHCPLWAQGDWQPPSPWHSSLLQIPPVYPGQQLCNSTFNSCPYLGHMPFNPGHLQTSHLFIWSNTSWIFPCIYMDGCCTPASSSYQRFLSKSWKQTDPTKLK